MPADESTRRPIDARRRRKQAHRDAMIEAATELFTSFGYAGTTMESVAAGSGMSVQSVYFTFHSKANLLQAALDRAAPAVPSVVEPDPEVAVVRLVEQACVELASNAGLALAAAAAAPGDEAAREVHDHHEARRSRVAAELVHQLRGRRPLAPGVTARRAADVVFGLLSPQLYSLMVTGRGWTAKRYAAWAADAIGRALWG